MTEPDLLSISFFAFIAVFSLLSVLAILMRVLTAVFPQKADGPDSALIAAITSAASLAYPGTRVTHIEETR
jgi:NADH:ubiquinone oxidoreductase subunit 2 (subunit N)